jgi:hypothetical protein
MTSCCIRARARMSLSQTLRSDCFSSTAFREGFVHSPPFRSFPPSGNQLSTWCRLRQSVWCGSSALRARLRLDRPYVVRRNSRPGIWRAEARGRIVPDRHDKREIDTDLVGCGNASVRNFQNVTPVGEGGKYSQPSSKECRYCEGRDPDRPAAGVRRRCGAHSIAHGLSHLIECSGRVFDELTPREAPVEHAVKGAMGTTRAIDQTNRLPQHFSFDLTIFARILAMSSLHCPGESHLEMT